MKTKEKARMLSAGENIGRDVKFKIKDDTQPSVMFKDQHQPIVTVVNTFHTNHF